MGSRKAIRQLTIEGFKSVRKLENLALDDLNVLIGSNGAGKSGFVSYFRMLHEMVEMRLQKWTNLQGEADRIVSFGIKETDRITSFIEFGRNGYGFKLEPTNDGGFVFDEEYLFFDGDFGPTRRDIGAGHRESKLQETLQSGVKLEKKIASFCHEAISSWKVFHFHDTSDTASVKRWASRQDNAFLRPDAANLAAFLENLRNKTPSAYEEIRETIQLAIPFFDDFVFTPRELASGEELVNLTWRQKDSDYILWPSQLSDGSLRFICLATALLQPVPPSTIIIDEPELGLHPYAITLLGALLRSASTRMQVIVSTQSVPLVSEFSVENLIVVEREHGETVFQRHSRKEFENWLTEYPVGELWEKNLLGGRLPK